MLIYHMTNGKNVTTQVILGAMKNGVSHGTHVWDKHKESVNELKDDGDVFVTGATFVGAVYEGAFYPRENFKHYIKG